MADEPERSRLIAEFSGVTDENTERARFYLESSGWQLSLALSSYYDNMGEDEGSPPPASGTDEHSGRPVPQQKPPARFGTLANMQSSDSDSEEQGQAFYAGGSERSGQQVLGPPRKKKNADEITQDVFEAAKRHGAEVVEDMSDPSAPTRPQAFRGAGYRLGDTPGAVSPAQTAHKEPQGPPAPKRVVLKFWSNGFTVDDGPLRAPDDPSNADFIKSVQKGEIPNELRQLSRGGEVHVDMEDHRGEDYEPPKQPRVIAFAGEGHKLGSPTPEVKHDHTPSSSSSAAAGTAATQLPTVDSTQPTTSLQIRLADGTRLVAKFNHTQTVADIRRFICASRPQMTRNFVLLTTFPNKELSDEGQTLADARLLNAVVVQRLR